MKKILCLGIASVFCLSVLFIAQGETTESKDVETIDSVAIVWTSGDPEVAKKMVFLYAYNAKKNEWFENIKFIIWGSSTLLVSQDKEIQDWVKKLDEAGVKLYACKWCADEYKVSELLEKLGVDVIYYGEPLTKLIKDDWKILTF